MNTPYIIDNNLLKDIGSLPAIAKTFYQDPNAQLLLFGEQFTEMMGFGIKGAQLALQNTYTGDATGFYKELQAQFNQLLNRAHTQHFYIPKELKIACKKLMQGICEANQEEFYIEFSNIAKSCIMKTKEKQEAAHATFLAYYKAVARAEGNDTEQMIGESKAEKNLTAAITKIKKKIELWSYEGVKAIEIEEKVCREIKGILNIGENPKIKSFSKSLVSKFSCEKFLDKFSKDLNDKVIPYQVALLGANFSKNAHAKLHVSDKEEHAIEMFLEKTGLTPTEIAKLYDAKLDINDMMIIWHTKKMGGTFVSRNKNIFSQIRKNVQLAKLLLPVTHKILKQTTLASSSQSAPHTTIVQKFAFPPEENHEDRSTTALQSNDPALAQGGNILSFTKPQGVFTSGAISKKMEALTEHQKDLLEKCLYLLTVADNNIPLTKTRNKFLPHLLNAVESLEAIHTLLDKMHEMELSHLLTTATIKRFSEKKEALNTLISMIDFLEDKELTTEGSIQSLMDTIDDLSSLQAGIHLLNEKNIFTRDHYNYLILAKENALLIAQSLFMLFEKEPKLINADTVKALLKSNIHAEKIAQSLLILFEKEPKLINTDTVKALFQSNIHAEKMAHFIIKLYEKGENTINTPCEKIISNMEEIIETIEKTRRHAWGLFCADPDLITDENLCLLKEAKEHAPLIIKGLITLHQENPSLLNERNREILLIAKEHAPFIIKGLITLHQASPSLVNERNREILLIAKHNAPFIAQALVVFYEQQENLLHDTALCDVLLYAGNAAKAVALNLVKLYQHDKTLIATEVLGLLRTLKPTELQMATLALCLLLPVPSLLKKNIIWMEVIDAGTNALYLAKGLLIIKNPDWINASVCMALVKAGPKAPLVAESIVTLQEKGISVTKFLNDLLQDKGSKISDTLSSTLLAHSQKEQERRRFAR